MIHSSRGIVLKTVKYSESSIIAKIYTEKFGLRSYIFKGIAGQKKHRTKALLQGLTLLDMLVYEKPDSNLQNVKDIENAYAFRSLPYDIRKSTIAMFLNEIIYKSIGEEVPNIKMFGFIFDEIIDLDISDVSIADFHLRFLIKFSAHLGFSPMNNYSLANRYFDFQEGTFVAELPFHTNYLDESNSKNFSRMIQGNNPKIFDNQKERNEMLEKIIQYYKLHVPAFGELKSYAVLKQILS